MNAVDKKDTPIIHFFKSEVVIAGNGFTDIEISAKEGDDIGFELLPPFPVSKVGYIRILGRSIKHHTCTRYLTINRRGKGWGGKGGKKRVRVEISH